ncbi:hypothetical protein EDD40_4848 [Saccharothrix texasensis]|uniref:Uncharacterized protein n=1 Tax=Saccharothrix texasensis TaxID=103734 RepID=A0A3N1HAA7_9PSEU|nr:hypothetical protein EDD40_4848 [Saccharothrix texasensis]
MLSDPRPGSTAGFPMSGYLVVAEPFQVSSGVLRARLIITMSPCVLMSVPQWTTPWCHRGTTVS